MSQFWHSHWAEDAFKPVMLGNWEVPNWHPKWPCIKHCITTSFLADKTGRLLPGLPRSKRSPWGDYKGTWQLPSRIDRKTAEKLSTPPKYKMATWLAHKKHYEGSCGIRQESPKRAKTSHVTKQQKSKKTGVTATPRKRGGGMSPMNTTDSDPKRTEKIMAKTRKDVVEKDDIQIHEKDDGKFVAKETAEDEEKNIPTEHSVEKKERDDTKKSRKIKCHCVDEPQSPKEVPKPKRDICTIHQRLRV